MRPKQSSGSYFSVLLHALDGLLRSAADKCCCLLTLSCKYFPSPIILSSYHPIILSFTPLQYGGELPKKGERWSAIEAVPFAAAQQWGGMGDTLMTTEKASLAFSILKRSCLEVRVRLRSRSSLE